MIRGPNEGLEAEGCMQIMEREDERESRGRGERWEVREERRESWNERLTLANPSTNVYYRVVRDSTEHGDAGRC